MSSPNHTYSSDQAHEEYLEQSHPISPSSVVTSNSWDESPPHSTHEENENENEVAENNLANHSHPTEQPPKFTARMKVLVPEPSFTFSLPRIFPLPKKTDLDRWLWIHEMIDFWRNRDGSPYDMVSESSTAPICQVTGEPTHHTIPVLVTQIDRQETAIEQMQYQMKAVPDPSIWEGMRQDISTVEYDCQGLRADFEKAGMDRGKVAWLEDRLINVENGLDHLRTSIDGLHEAMASIFRELRNSKKKDIAMKDS